MLLLFGFVFLGANNSASAVNNGGIEVPDTNGATQYISEKNIATGYNDYTYRPNDYGTQAQFASILARTIEPKSSSTNKVVGPFKKLKLKDSIKPLSPRILAYSYGAQPGSIREFSYDGGKYAAMEFNESLYAYDFTENKTVAKLGRHFKAFQANKEIVYVENDFRTIKIYNIETKKTEDFKAHGKLNRNTVSLSPNGRYLKFAISSTKELFVFDRKNKKLITVPASIIDTNVDNPWDGDTFYFWGYTEKELVKHPFGGMTEAGSNQGIWSYNVKTGEVKQTKLQPRKVGWPANFTVNEGKIVLEDTNVYLYDIKTEEIKTVVTREKEYGKAYLTQVFFPSVSSTTVFYTYYGQVMQYDIATGKTTQISNLKAAKPDPMDEMYSSRSTYVNGDYLYILGNDVTFTVYRYR